MDKSLLALLVCPRSNAPLIFREDLQELHCQVSRLAYPVRDQLPVLLVEEARELTEQEIQ